MQVNRRRGAAERASNETARKIVVAARELLMTEGYAQFSMRNVAARAGLHLANVQYYYKTREDLVRALLDDTGERYRSSYEQLRAKAPTDREARVKAVVEFNLEDIATAMTEGMVVVRRAHSRNPAELKKLMARAQGMALQIALGLVPDVN